jgi:glycosyltransferase involved in cell wall biosynthesis
MIGLLRVRNEARWIERSISSILPVCDRVLVMDDHSDDGTPDLCRAIERVTVLASPFGGLDETRDKNWLLDKARGAEWVMMIDGDEVLAAGAPISELLATSAVCLSPRILYLWDREDQVRVDGVYGRFRRPSIFRPGASRFASTSAGGNFHCGNVPLALQSLALPIDVSLLHFGYLHREDRLRKYRWYNQVDPGNANEDGYQHMVQGDIPEVPAGARLRHAGPLELVTLG